MSPDSRPASTERDAPACMQRDDLTVYESIRWKSLARTGDMRELSCEEVFAPRPQRDATRISASETAVSVKLDLVEPFFALGQVLHQPRIHGLDKPDFGWRQRAEGLGLTRSENEALPAFSGSFSLFSHFGLWRYRLLFFLDCRFVSSFSDNVLSCFALGLYRLLFFLSCRRRYRCLFPLF